MRKSKLHNLQHFKNIACPLLDASTKQLQPTTVESQRCSEQHILDAGREISSDRGLLLKRDITASVRRKAQAVVSRTIFDMALWFTSYFLLTTKRHQVTRHTFVFLQRSLFLLRCQLSYKMFFNRG